MSSECRSENLQQPVARRCYWSLLSIPETVIVMTLPLKAALVSQRWAGWLLGGDSREPTTIVLVDGATVPAERQMIFRTYRDKRW
jgi:hypothetical protein